MGSRENRVSRESQVSSPRLKTVASLMNRIGWPNFSAAEEIQFDYQDDERPGKFLSPGIVICNFKLVGDEEEVVHI
jgi:hypothetical protein